MKAISIYQPWATLIAIGAKKYETRSWMAYHRGMIAIHASARWNRDLARLCRVQPFMSALFNAGYRVEHSWMGPKGSVGDYGLPLGCIVGVARLDVCSPTSDVHGNLHKWMSELERVERSFGDFSPGRHAYRLDDDVRLERPIVLRGHMRIWELEPDVAREVEDQVSCVRSRVKNPR